ncbi:MAG TPA: transglycosylase domain-containing protein [Solirubrobacteraceae bacterium]|nr:transglycosylase domain-containing protein [Solirubrobacteraceae bacterium]
MSESERTSDPAALKGEGAADGNGDGGATVLHLPLRHARRRGGGDGDGEGEGPGGTRSQVRIRKLRVLALLFGLGALAAVSTVFGMMMAVASDLPQMEDPLRGRSVILDANGVEMGVLTGNQRQLFVSEAQIAPVMKQAIIAIEDRRFYTNEGYDLRGIGRALWQDVVNQRVVQGGSTITQQFVKNALAAQNDRTLFVKLREAALAYQLTRKWSKERILRNYLNTIYFGNGAYGIESAAQTYFGRDHQGCEQDKSRPCAAQLELHEAALLAGMVASPSGFDPVAHPAEARQRRSVVLDRMRDQGLIDQVSHDAAAAESLPTRADIAPPREDTKYPYFTSWVKQQVVDKLGGGQVGARRAFTGGLTVKTTLDSKVQEAATTAIRNWLPFSSGPRASMVAIENKTGMVRAMVGGDDYAQSSFNLATQGQRQPGSSFKPFVLAEALRQGISPGSTWQSRKKVFTLKGGEKFEVNNYNDAYAGVTTLANATTNSDNSVYAELGLKLGPKKVAAMARRLGVRTHVSRNAANALGGLKEGVTPIDMAHAYETFAQRGELTYGSLSPGNPDDRKVTPIPGPVAIESIGRGKGKDYEPLEIGGRKLENRKRTRRVLAPAVADQVSSILQTVVKSGTATRAFVPGVTVAGKTGTTEGYGDAWFVGWTKEYTVAIWVGYPDKFKPMETEFQGDPVAGGTYPAGIFKTFIDALVGLKKVKKDTTETEPAVPPGASTGVSDAPSTPDTDGAIEGGGAPPASTPVPQQQEAPADPAPEQETPAEPPPEQPAEPPPDQPAEPAPDTGGAQPGAGTG